MGEFFSPHTAVGPVFFSPHTAAAVRERSWRCLMTRPEWGDPTTPGGGADLIHTSPTGWARVATPHYRELTRGNLGAYVLFSMGNAYSTFDTARAAAPARLARSGPRRTLKARLSRQKFRQCKRVQSRDHRHLRHRRGGSRENGRAWLLPEKKLIAPSRRKEGISIGWGCSVLSELT